jgi:hypothetical protein
MKRWAMLKQRLKNCQGDVDQPQRAGRIELGMAAADC